jgi:uncharacterized protein YggU (UPF0235/DUF167 family)
VGRLALRVQPRARKNEIGGWRAGAPGRRAGALVVRVTAAPVGGKANDAVRRLIAERLGVAASRVSIVRGESSRDKLVEVEGVDDAALRRALGA